MSLESFFGLEEGESQGNAEASEKFREQMRKSAKAIAAMGVHQQIQKKKEDQLARLLVKLLQDDNKGDVIFLVVKLLQENVPGAFILAILSISDAELEEELKKALAETPVAHALDIDLPMQLSLPQELQEELHSWMKLLLHSGLMLPGKTLATVLTHEQKLKSIVLDLFDYSLELYFERHGMQTSEEQLRSFGLLSLQAVLIKLREVALQKTDEEIIETPLEEGVPSSL